MLRNMLLGMAAGAAGTAALNIATYLDMTIRGRASSGVPAQVVETLAEEADIPLKASEEEEEAAQNRTSGAGALLGYDTGLGIGAAYGLLRPQLASVPRPAAGAGLGLAAMLASDLPATLLGVTNPKEWSVSSWVSDIVPHMAYGLVAAMVMHEFRAR